MKNKSTRCLKTLLSLAIIVSIFLQSATGVFAEIKPAAAESVCYGELYSEVSCSDCYCDDCEQTATCGDESCVDCYSFESALDQKSSLIYTENISSNGIELLGYNDATCTADGCVNGVLTTEVSSTCATCSGLIAIASIDEIKCSACSGNGYTYTTDNDSVLNALYCYIYACTYCGGSGSVSDSVNEDDDYSDAIGHAFEKMTTGITNGTFVLGSGYTSYCFTCNGTGKAVCPDCNGNGYTSTGAGVYTSHYGCTTCGGSGGGYVVTTSYIAGSGYLSSPCEDCSGYGMYITTVDCPNCVDGKTYTMVSTACSECGGDGLTNTATIKITSDIQDVTIFEDENVTFSLEAESLYTEDEKFTDDFSYQWYKNSSLLLGETDSTLTIGEDESIGTYVLFAVVSEDGFEDVQSSMVVLTVVSKVEEFSVVKDVEDVTISEGGNTTLNVSAQLLYSDGTTSSDGITYQWYQNNVAISGANSSDLTVGNGLSSGSYSFYCEMSADGADTIKSSIMVLTVSAVPVGISIVQDISDTTVVEGNNAVFETSAKVEYSDGDISSDDITYQWYMNGVQISGATSSTLTIGSDISIGSYLIYALATCGDYSVRTSVVEFDVVAKKYLDVTYSFSDMSITENVTTKLYVVASAKDTLGNSYSNEVSYQWYIDNVEVEGEASGVYSFKGELQTQTATSGEEEKISPSNYLVQAKLSCDGCDDVWVTATITVEANDGTLTVCNTCYGATVITCTNCLGSGEEECVYCGATGIVYVDYANFYNQACTVCSLTGYVDCYLCDGGLMDCPDCGGDYTVSLTNTNTVQEDDDAWYIEAIKKLFLSVTIYMAGMIDLLINLFKKLVGLEDVNIGDSSTNILMYFLELEAVSNVVMYIIVIAFIMLFLFTTIQFIRAMKISDEKVNATKTVESFFLAAGNILLVPLLLVVLIFSANVIMGQINEVFESGLVYSQSDYEENAEISYGGQMLLLLTETEYDKAKILDMTVDGVYWADVAEELYNGDLGTVNDFFPNGQINPDATFGENSIIFTHGESFPSYYYMDSSNWTNDSGIWGNSTDSEGMYYIPTSRLQVFIAFAGCIAMLFSLIMCSFTFVKRIFDVLLLYIVSPLMISTMPLDDGTRFKQWRDILISKVLAAYAIVLTVNLYFMIVPTIIINPGVIFSQTSTIANGIIQLIFVIGGAFALHGSNAMFGQLLGTGNMEQQQNIGTQMMMMNMVRVGAGVALGTGKFAVKHTAGTAAGSVSGFVKGGGENGSRLGGMIKGGAGYIGSSVGSSKFGKSVNSWARKTQNGTSSLIPANNTTNVSIPTNNTTNV